MRTEKVLWSFALACAVFLLFAPFTPRTMWYSADTERPGGTSSVRHSAGWEWVVPLCGIAAIVGLTTGIRTRRLVTIPVLGAGAASIAFVVAAVAAGGHWIDGMRGALALGAFRTSPAPGAPYFAVVATVGAGYALVLAIGWLKPADADW